MSNTEKLVHVTPPTYISLNSKMGKMMMSMDEQEELVIIDRCKEHIKNNHKTKKETIIQLYKFMGMWDSGDRPFTTLHKYIKEISVHI